MVYTCAFACMFVIVRCFRDLWSVVDREHVAASEGCTSFFSHEGHGQLGRPAWCVVHSPVQKKNSVPYAALCLLQS